MARVGLMRRRYFGFPAFARSGEVPVAGGGARPASAPE